MSILSKLSKFSRGSSVTKCPDAPPLGALCDCGADLKDKASKAVRIIKRAKEGDKNKKIEELLKKDGGLYKSVNSLLGVLLFFSTYSPIEKETDLSKLLKDSLTFKKSM